jgi:hypothetical protein
VNQYILWYLGLLERGLLEVIFHQEKVEFKLEAADFVFDGDQPFFHMRNLAKKRNLNSKIVRFWRLSMARSENQKNKNQHISIFCF